MTPQKDRMTTEQWVNELNEYKKPKGKEEIHELSFAWFKMKKWPIMAVSGEGLYVSGQGWGFDISSKKIDITIAPQKSQRFDVSTIDQIQDLLKKYGHSPIDFNMYIRLKELRKKLL